MLGDRSSSDKVAIVFAYFLTLLAVLANFDRSTPAHDIKPNWGYEQNEKSTRTYCNAKLRSFGADPPTSRSTSKADAKPDEWDNYCQQIRAAEAAEKQADWAVRQAWVAGGAFVAAAVAAFLAGLAAHHTKRQADLASLSMQLVQRNDRRQQRAYVSLTHGNITRIRLIEGGGGLRIVIGLRNSGTTPAYDFTTWVMPAAILPPDADPFGPPRPPSERNGASIIGPGAEVQIDVAMPATESLVAAMTASTMRLFVWGGCDYTDIFGKKRWFRFNCVSGGIRDGTWPVAPHIRGYSASEQSENDEDNMHRSPL